VRIYSTFLCAFIRLFCAHSFDFSVCIHSTFLCAFIRLFCAHSFDFSVRIHSTFLCAFIQLFCAHSSIHSFIHSVTSRPKYLNLNRSLSTSPQLKRLALLSQPYQHCFLKSPERYHYSLSITLYKMYYKMYNKYCEGLVDCTLRNTGFIGRVYRVYRQGV
jgi:hypothetical protein